MPRQASQRQANRPTSARTGQGAAKSAATNGSARSTTATKPQGKTGSTRSTPGEARTQTSKNQTKASNRQSGMHQRPPAKRETTRESRASQSKRTSTGSRSAKSAASATPEQERTRDQLYQRAAELGINGRSRMTKPELVDAIRTHSQR